MSHLFGPKVAIARTAGALSRRSGRGGGTTLPGRLLLRMAPDAIARLGSRLHGGTTIVSATNGKTTTAGMIAAALRAAGREPVHNRAGSNMTWGVATALLEQHGSEGLFEVDEAWLPRVAAELEPRLVVLGNLFRDQLDRYGELEHLADEWAATVADRAGATEFALNADDPLIADLGRDAELARRPGVTYFGIETRPRRSPSYSMPSTPSTAAAAGRLIRMREPSSGTWAITAARTAERIGRLRMSRQRGSSSRECAAPASRSARPRATWRSACQYRVSTTSTTRWRR